MMLTLEASLRAQKQATAYGQGRHQFGGPEPKTTSLRDDATDTPDKVEAVSEETTPDPEGSRT